LWAIAGLSVEERLLSAKALQGNTSLVGAAVKENSRICGLLPHIDGQKQGDTAPDFRMITDRRRAIVGSALILCGSRKAEAKSGVERFGRAGVVGFNFSGPRR